jgi:predicted MFS family arabinose efflux permease
VKPRLPDTLGALHEREFRLLFTGQAISLLGDGMVGVALAFAVLDLTGSISDLGYVFAARTIPLVVFLLVGGVFADRLPRRAVMLTADVVRLGAQGAMAALLISGHAQLWHLIVTQAVYGSAAAFFNPASTGLIPAVVSPGRLQQANALRALAMAAGSVAGPVLSGILVAAASPGWALAVDAASFGASAVFLAMLRLPVHEKAPVKPFLHELGEGWHEVISRSWVWSILIFAGVANMASNIFFILGAYVAKHDLGGAGAWALITSALGVGAIVGGIVVLRVRPRFPLRIAAMTFALFALPPALLALGAPVGVIAAGALFAGLGGTFGNTLWETALQRHIPRHALSRVSAYDWLVSLGLSPVGQILVGPLVIAVGINSTLWGVVVVLLVGTAGTLCVRQVRELGNGEPTPQVQQQVVHGVGEG